MGLGSDAERDCSRHISCPGQDNGWHPIIPYTCIDTRDPIILSMIMLILFTILSIPEAFDEQKLTTMEHGTCGEPLTPNPHSHALHATSPLWLWRLLIHPTDSLSLTLPSWYPWLTRWDKIILKEYSPGEHTRRHHQCPNWIDPCSFSVELPFSPITFTVI